MYRIVAENKLPLITLAQDSIMGWDNRLRDVFAGKSCTCVCKSRIKYECRYLIYCLVNTRFC